MALAVAGLLPACAEDGQIIRDQVHASPDGNQARYLLIKPQGYDPTRKYALFIFLHGDGGSPDLTLRYDHELLTHRDFFILLPQAPDRSGNGFYYWYNLADDNQFIADLNRDESLLKQMIEEVTVAHNIDRSQIVLSGFSSGGRLSFCIGFRNPKLFSKIIPIGGYYMPELLDSRIRDLTTLKVSIYHGTDDTVNPFDSMKESYEFLRHKGVAVHLTTYALGHTYTSQILGIVLDEVK